MDSQKAEDLAEAIDITVREPGFRPRLGFKQRLWSSRGFPGGSDGKESACNEEDLGSISGLGRSSREGNGHPLQYSCLENPMGQDALPLATRMET